MGKRVRKLEGGDSWVAVSVFGGTVLLLSWGSQNCGIAVISEKEKKELLAGSKQTPPIVNALKSSISGAELTGVCQLNRDRIIRLTFTKIIGAGFSNTRHLTLEMMERYSNLIFTDENETILETAKHIHPADNRFRSVLPGHHYSMPPEFNGIPLEDWLRDPTSDTLRSVAGFGKKLLEKLSEVEVERAARLLDGFYKNETDTSLYTPQKIKNYLTVLPELLEGASPLPDAAVSDTGHLTVMSPIADVSIQRRRKAVTDQIRREIVRRERQIKDIEKLLYEEDADKYKKYGDALVANSWQITPGAREASVTYWDGDGNEIRDTVPLDPRLSAAKNAASYYAKYKKIISARERAVKILAKVKEELDDLREQYAIVMSMDDPESLALVEEELGIKVVKNPKNGRKKTAAPLPPHKRFDLGYALVFAGLSSRGNRYVTFKLASPGDIWFHARGVPGSHVILRFTSTPTEEERDKAIRFCASLAAKYSRNGGSPGQRVDYTLRKFVSPIRGGEANVTYRNFSSIAAGNWDLERH
ncbi:MAG TPA: NFACT family protein [Synergistaceae bacterium]|jgi:predicted ribosome quality control (RQC) complex YloA/Tae2 family protein|nr:NFACT family protein [Synergistaceae bacterium]HPX03764.1 NFACT family protein [Synergistaceae bacterium]HQA54573.1 NFACT family protein [Synergistaceae bacterium]